jgi:hypothetical protein
MSTITSIDRGWITVHTDDGAELRLSPADAIQDRAEHDVPWSAIWKASVQRLAFWRRASR